MAAKVVWLRFQSLLRQLRTLVGACVNISDSNKYCDVRWDDNSHTLLIILIYALPRLHDYLGVAKPSWLPRCCHAFMITSVLLRLHDYLGVATPSWLPRCCHAFMITLVLPCLRYKISTIIYKRNSSRATSSLNVVSVVNRTLPVSLHVADIRYIPVVFNHEDIEINNYW